MAKTPEQIKSLHGKYNRVSTDPSQAQMFADEIIDILADEASQLTSVNEALSNLNKYKGYDLITYDKTNCVRIDKENSLEENTLKQTSAIVLSDSEMLIVDELIKKAIKYGFIIYVTNKANNSYYIMPLVSARLSPDNRILAIFGAASVSQNEGEGFTIELDYATKTYYCELEEI